MKKVDINRENNCFPNWDTPLSHITFNDLYRIDKLVDELKKGLKGAPNE